jgi:type IV pilus assembly protein PilP
MTPRATVPVLLLIVLSLLGLSACSDSGHDELNAWMVEQKNSLKPRVEPVNEPKRFVPEAYSSVGVTDPFNLQKLTSVFKSEAQNPVGNSALVTPELNRRKEPLEAFPLDTMSMVGSLQKKGRQVALIKVDKLVYQVDVGAYMGQNYGKVVKISETDMTLREVVQDAAGEWIERATVMQLQEGVK